MFVCAQDSKNNGEFFFNSMLSDREGILTPFKQVKLLLKQGLSGSPWRRPNRVPSRMLKYLENITSFYVVIFEGCYPLLYISYRVDFRLTQTLNPLWQWMDNLPHTVGRWEIGCFCPAQRWNSHWQWMDYVQWRDCFNSVVIWHDHGEKMGFLQYCIMVKI